MLSIKNLNITFDKPLFINQDIEIKDHCVTLIVGESGCGKTSLLYKLGLLNFHKDDGTYYIDNILVNQLSKKQMTSMRRYHIAYVFQEYMLYDHFNVYENLNYYALMIGKEISAEEAIQYLKQVHLDIELDRSLYTLSGGQKQRLAIACALIKQSKILILDEPTSALDEENAKIIFEILQELKKEKTIIMTSHNQLSHQYCDEIIEIKEGKITKIKEVDKQEEPKDIIFSKMHMPLSVYMHYIKKQFQFMRKTKWSIFISNILILSFCIGVVACVHYGISSNKDIISSENPGWMYVKTLQEDEVDKLHANQYYPYYEAYLMIGADNYPVIPYYDEEDILDELWTRLNITDEEGIYLSQKLYYETRGLIGIENDAILMDPVTFEELSFVYKGILLKGVTSEYTDNIQFIYMPYSLIEERLPNKTQKGYTLYFNSYESISQAKETLENENHEVIMYDEYSDIEKYVEQLNQVEKYMNYCVVVIGMIILYYIYQSYISSRQKEVALLKSMGLTNYNITMLIFLESMMMCMVGFICVTVCTIWFIDYSILEMCCFEIALLVSILMIIMIKVIRIQPIKVLRDSK